MKVSIVRSLPGVFSLFGLFRKETHHLARCGNLGQNSILWFRLRRSLRPHSTLACRCRVRFKELFSGTWGAVFPAKSHRRKAPAGEMPGQARSCRSPRPRTCRTAIIHVRVPSAQMRYRRMVRSIAAGPIPGRGPRDRRRTDTMAGDSGFGPDRDHLRRTLTEAAATLSATTSPPATPRAGS